MSLAKLLQDGCVLLIKNNKIFLIRFILLTWRIDLCSVCFVYVCVCACVCVVGLVMIVCICVHVRVCVVGLVMIVCMCVCVCVCGGPGNDQV